MTPDREVRLGILTEFRGHHHRLVAACQELAVPHTVIDIAQSDWIERVRTANCDAFLVSPSDSLSHWKTMYEERVYYMESTLNQIVYPSFRELYYYENKKNLAYWLQANRIPHPHTWVFYDSSEAQQFARHCALPVVFKTSIGSAASGVMILRSRAHLALLTRRLFPLLHIGPGGFTRWVNLKHRYKIPISVPILSDRQKGYLILQEYVHIKWEWRIVKIGESFFGHQKLKRGDFHSGSLLVGWVEPPPALLDFVRAICAEHNIRVMAFDVFETQTGAFLVNEMQTSFGSYNNSQMYINDVPGRFVFRSGGWVFEEGYFNRNGSNNLRVLDLLCLLSERLDGPGHEDSRPLP